MTLVNTSTSIEVFNFEGNNIRTLVDESGDLWFIAKDVCEVLGTDTRDLRKILDDDEVSNVDSIHIGENGGRAPLIVSEPGFFSLANRSRKRCAKKFQRWVNHEVLPQIHHTGGYVPAAESDVETMARAVLIAQKTIELQKQQLKAQEHKVLFADAVSASDGTCLVGELAKMLTQAGFTIGQNKLFALLRDDGYLGKSGSNKNVPLQRYVEQGLFKIKETAVAHSDGHVTLNRTTKVTGKGQTYFVERYAHTHAFEFEEVE